MQKARGSNPAPASHRAAAGQRTSHIAKRATPNINKARGRMRNQGGQEKAKSAQMSDLGCFWPSTGVAASAAAASHVNGHSQANYAQKHQPRSGRGKRIKNLVERPSLLVWEGYSNGVGRDSRSWNWPYPSCRSKIISESWP